MGEDDRDQGDAPGSVQACAGCSESSRPIIYRATRLLCGVCFEDFLLRKFMRAMRCANIRTGDAVVVGLSNGICSAVLADLFARSVRPRDELHVTTVHARAADEPGFQFQLGQYGWTHADIALAAPLPSGSADALHEWRRAAVLRALEDEAHRSGARVVLVGDCAERLATNMLACAASGGRALGAVDRCQESSMIEGVVFVRPLHLITTEQITIWAAYRQLQYLPDQDGAPEGLYGTTYRFLMDLQTTFPSCVSNVIRTTAKLVRGDQAIRCELCRDPIVTEAVGDDARFCDGCVQSGLSNTNE